MVAVAFDTLKVARRLAESGMDARTAEGVSMTLAEAWAAREDTLSTKSDLRELEGRMRAEFRQGHIDTLRWVIGSQIALTGLLFAAIKLL